jgi:hypothetical protein
LHLGLVQRDQRRHGLVEKLSLRWGDKGVNAAPG